MIKATGYDMYNLINTLQNDSDLRASVRKLLAGGHVDSVIEIDAREALGPIDIEITFPELSQLRPDFEGVFQIKDGKLNRLNVVEVEPIKEWKEWK